MKKSLNLIISLEEYEELFELSADIIKHIEFRTYLYDNKNLKNTDEYQELRKYLRGMSEGQ